MVQILPAKRTFGAEFGRSFGSGVAEGVGTALKGREERKRLEKSNAAFKEAGVDIPNGLTGKEREIYIAETLKGNIKKNQEEEKEKRIKDQIKENYGEKKSIGEKLMEGETEKPQINEQNERPKALDWSDREIAEMRAIDKGQADLMQKQKDVALRENTAEKKAKATKDAAELKQKNDYNQELRKETFPYRKEIAERGDTGRRTLENQEELNKLIDTGNLNDPTFATLMEALPFNIGARFLSKESTAYKGELVQGYSILKNLFSGATRVKELEIAEDKIANLYLTDEQKKSVLKSMARAANVDVIRADASQDVESDISSGKLNQMGLLGYRKEVEKRTKEKQNALFDRIVDEQDSIIKNAENIKKMPLSLEDPEHIQIIDQALIDSNGDYEKATEALRKKGYKIEDY